MTKNKATSANQHKDERYEAFIRNSSEGIWLFELEKPIPTTAPTQKQVEHFFKYAYLAEANMATAKMYGFRSTKKMIGMRLTDFMVESDPENIAYLSAFVESGYNLSGVESHEVDIKGNDKYFRNSLVGVVENGQTLRAWGTQQDVTSQRMAMKELERSRERLDLALQATAMGIWEWDVVNNELYWSPELKKLFGLKVKDDITYEKYQGLLHPDDREHMLEVIKESLATGSTYQVEHRIIWPDGTVHWRLGLGKAHLENGKPIRMVGTSMDIDNRKQNEIALHRQNAYLEALHTTAKETFEGMGRSSKVLESILKYAREISRTSDSYLYLLTPSKEMVVSVGTGIFSDHIGHAVKKGEGLVGKVWSSGKPIVIDSYDTWKGRQSDFPKGMIQAIVGIPLFVDGEINGVLAFAQQKPHKKFDIQQVIALSRLAELASVSLKNASLFQKVQESEKRFRGMADSAPVMIWLADPDKKRTYFNSSWLKFTGSTLKRELGNGWYRHAHKDDVERYRTIYETSFDKRIHFSIEYRLRRKDGAYRWVLSTASPRFSPGGDFLGYIGSCIDIHDVKEASELKLANTQLKNQRSQLLALNRAKNDFVALASHQLRTPATAVKQYLGLLTNEFAGKLNPQQQKYASVAYESNERQLTIINDLLRTAQIESGRFQLEKRRHDMAQVLRDAVQEMSTTFEMRRQKVKLAGFEPVMVSIDSTEMNLVLINLLENASKYSHNESEIHVSMRKSGGKVEVVVRDFGVGIDAHDRQRIFDKFTRIDNELSDTVAGTGLGLYWVKRIILLHGGTITVNSEPGKGSSFIMRLPL